MTHPPRTVAVVIPCWNAEAWIADAVRSAIAQPRVELDVVVVDDGSDDDSVRVAMEAGEGRVRILRQGRLGVSRARTAGTMAARGEYVQYLDADDVLAPETLVHRIEALEHAEADVAYTDWVRWEQQSDATFVEGDVCKGDPCLPEGCPGDTLFGQSPDDPDEFYAHQLVGLAAYDEAGTRLGEVSALVRGGAQDLLTVRTPDGRDALVPFVKALVPEVDLAAGRVVVADRPGLVTPLEEER